ncbi:hypothetical protein [Fundicoccus ignavus]|uniref:DUF6199 domain-containing protein n=1 Tax=Fundicoccus ignavus TaxID=2664442 RepID=A0A844CHB1_9LACT|nr:hypothetical protein [Fundicoccus ignavus]MRJ48520.1 hypothetical protein [Fundicoccus ignavus]
MSKIVKLISLLLVMTFIVVGCRTEKAQEVATYDEAHSMEQRDRYRELTSYFNEEYADNSDDMEKDPLYSEYVRLNGIVQIGDESRVNIFKGRVYLDKQTIQYGNQVIEYNENENTIVLSENPTELMDETFVRMIRLAKQQETEDREHNFRLLITAGWLPVFTLIVGLIGWFKPRWVWYFEGGFRNKDAEPSNNALLFVKIQAVIAFTLTIFFVYLLFNRMS